VLDKPARLIPVPVWFLTFLGEAGDILARIAPIGIPSILVDRVCGSLVVDSGKLTRFTGFEPPFTLVDGLRETAVWYRQRFLTD